MIKLEHLQQKLKNAEIREEEKTLELLETKARLNESIGTLSPQQKAELDAVLKKEREERRLRQKARVDKLNQRVTELSQELRRTNSKKNQLLSNNTRYVRDIDTLNDQLVIALKALASQKMQNEEIILEKQALLAAMEQTGNSSLELINQQRNAIQALQTANIEFQRQFIHLREIVEANEREKEALNEQIAESKMMTAQAVEKLNELSNQKNELNAQVTEQQRINQILFNAGTNQANEFMAYKKAQEEKYLELQKLAQQKYDEALGYNRDKEAELATLQRQFTNALNILGQKDQDYADLARKFESMSMALTQGTQAYNTLLTNYQQSHVKSVETEKELAKLHASNSRAFHDISVLDAQLAQQLAENQNLNNNLVEFKNLHQKHQMLMQDANLTSYYLGVAQEEVAKFQNQSAYFKDRLEKMQKQKQALALKHKNTIAELKKVRATPAYQQTYAIKYPAGSKYTPGSTQEGELTNKEIINILEQWLGRIGVNADWTDLDIHQPHDFLYDLVLWIRDGFEQVPDNWNEPVINLVNELKKGDPNYLNEIGFTL